MHRFFHQYNYHDIKDRGLESFYRSSFLFGVFKKRIILQNSLKNYKNIDKEIEHTKISVTNKITEVKKMEPLKMQISMIVVILLTAVVAFGVADFYGQPLNWYLFILMVLTGFFIHTIIAILQTKDDIEDLN